jgi:hypothetical protein
MAGAVREDLVEQVDDLLTNIHGSIVPPPDPNLPEPTPETLADIVEALKQQDPEDLDTSAPHVLADFIDDDVDEPTRQWVRTADGLVAAAPAKAVKIPKAPPSARGFPLFADEVFDGYDDHPNTPATLRPSSVSLQAARKVVAPQRSFFGGRKPPIALAFGAVAAIVAAVAAYELGPRSSQPAETARRHTAPIEAAASDALRARAPVAEAPAPAAAPAPAGAQRVIIEVTPSSAYLSVRLLSEVEGKHSAGPWPRAFELEPGEYELVAFRAGYKTTTRRVVIKPELAPQSINLSLIADDIYE